MNTQTQTAGKTAVVANDNALQAEIARLKAENEALKKGKMHKPSCKVSAKGAVSVYGLGRFPFTFYKSQFFRLKDMMGEIEAFIKANESKLAVKEDAKVETEQVKA